MFHLDPIFPRFIFFLRRWAFVLLERSALVFGRQYIVPKLSFLAAFLSHESRKSSMVFKNMIYQNEQSDPIDYVLANLDHYVLTNLINTI